MKKYSRISAALLAAAMLLAGCSGGADNSISSEKSNGTSAVAGAQADQNPDVAVKRESDVKIITDDTQDEVLDNPELKEDDQPGSSAEDSQDENPASSNADTSANSTDASKSSGWQKTYSDKLNGVLKTLDDDIKSASGSNAKRAQAVKDVYRFELYDMDNDKIPELFISVGTSHFADCTCYVYKNGKAVDTKLKGEFGVISCRNDKSLVMTKTSSSGVMSLRIYQKNSSGIELFKSFYDTQFAPQAELSYKVDGNEVSAKAYLDEYFVYSNYAWDKVGRKNKFTAAEIDSAIKNWKPDEPSDKDYKELYKDIMQEYMKSDEYIAPSGDKGSCFDLRDLDDDGVPELFISTLEKDGATNNFHVYTILEGKAAEMNIGSSYGICNISSDGNNYIIHTFNSGTEISRIYVYQKSGRDKKLVFQSEKNLSKSSQYNYLVNRLETDKDSYNKSTSKYTSIKTDPVGRKYQLTKDSIGKVL